MKRASKKTASERMAEKNAKATRRLRKAAKETAELQEQVRRGEKTAGKALCERLGKKR